MSKKILFGNDARQQIKAGIDKCVDVVKITLGGQGKNVLIYNGAFTEVINDGVSIAKAVNVKNEVEQAGIQLAKQCSNQTDEDAGDGTTTTLVLLQAILNEIITEVNLGNPRETRDRLFAEANAVLDKVEVKQIETTEDIYNLALTSSLSADMARVISSIYEKLGKDANISVEETHRNTLEYEIIEGMKIETKRAEIKVLRKEGKQILEDCKVVVVDKVENISEIEGKIIEAVKDKLSGMVVISNSFSPKALLSMMKISDFTIIPVEYSMMKPIGDVETYVGEGRVRKVIIDKDSTTIIGGAGNVAELVENLEKRKETEESQYEKENISGRVAQLKGKIAIIRIGRNTDVERNEAVLKLEDALGAVKGAYEMGYCKGGGKALKDVGYRFNIYDQICENYGGIVEVPETVIDSFKTVKYSLLNAISTATSILMVEAALIEENED